MATSPQAQKSLDRQGQGQRTQDSRPLTWDHEVAVCSQPGLGCKGFCGNSLRRIPVPRMVPRFKNLGIFSSFQKIPSQISGRAPEELIRAVRTRCSSLAGLTGVADATTRVVSRRNLWRRVPQVRRGPVSSRPHSPQWLSMAKRRNCGLVSVSVKSRNPSPVSGALSEKSRAGQSVNPPRRLVDPLRFFPDILVAVGPVRPRRRKASAPARFDEIVAVHSPAGASLTGLSTQGTPSSPAALANRSR